MAKVSMNLKIKGFKETLMNLRELPENLQKKVLWPATIEAAERVRDKAVEIEYGYVDDPRTNRAIAPAIIIKRQVKESNETKSIIVSVGVDKKQQKYFYWVYLEKGTSKTKARSFLRRGLFESKEKAIASMLSVAKYEISKLRFRK